LLKLYILIALDPYNRQWALYIIFLANVIAIILDFGSVILGEYKLSYAMIDVPFEMMSITGIVLIFWTIKIKSKFPACFQTFSVLL
jgi:hypothetical protein